MHDLGILWHVVRSNGEPGTVNTLEFRCGCEIRVLNLGDEWTRFGMRQHCGKANH